MEPTVKNIMYIALIQPVGHHGTSQVRVAVVVEALACKHLVDY